MDKEGAERELKSATEQAGVCQTGVDIAGIAAAAVIGVDLFTGRAFLDHGAAVGIRHVRIVLVIVDAHGVAVPDAVPVVVQTVFARLLLGLLAVLVVE